VEGWTSAVVATGRYSIGSGSVGVLPGELRDRWQTAGSGGGVSYLMMPGRVSRRRRRGADPDPDPDDDDDDDDAAGGGGSGRCADMWGAGCGSARGVHAVAKSSADGFRLIITRSGQSK